MRLGIKNKYALVTGAGRGIGRSIAVSLAKEGVKVIAVSRTALDLEDLIGAIGGTRKGHYSLVSDLTKENGPRKIIEELNKKNLLPDILINNLGGTLDIKDPFCSISEWRKIWRLNFEVAIELNNFLIPSMREKKWGRIVNISSISALENQGTVPYCTLKAAFTAYTRSMGRVLAPDGIIMTAVLPGAIRTKGGYWDKMVKTNPEHVEYYLRERMRIGRFGKPEEISSVVAFLCSSQASFCVGTCVVVDGGQGRSFFP